MKKFTGAMRGKKEQSEINNQRIHTIPFWLETMQAGLRDL